MKKLNFAAGLAFLIAPAIITSCSRNAAKYENLETGEKVHIVKSESGVAVDSVSGEPVKFYVDLTTKDTIYGETGMVVNNALIKTPEGTYMLDEAKIKSDGDEWKAKSEDVKIKVDGDEMKIKTDDKKVKIDGDERKVEYDN